MPAPTTHADPDRDARLAALLAALGDEARQGRQPDLDAAAARHPDLADELRQLWAAACFADELSRHRRGPSRPAAPAPQPGALPRPFGDFDLLEEVGRGGMGVVYKAYQRGLKRTVALKMILRGDHATAADAARFQAEAEAAARLDHPNIVAVHGVGQTDGQPWFSMPFVEGRPLSALLAEGPLRPLDAARLLAPVCRAVHHAHERGVLHRDLKPSNILLDADGRPHVTDFGLAKRVGGDAPALTATGAVVGTPAYMAPEQVSGSRGTPSPASDVYSLGVVLYEMLTGRPPFQAATPVDTLLLVLDQEPVRPRDLNPKVDPDLELICLKCIQKEPRLRYASAAALADDLERCARGEVPSVRSTKFIDIGSLFTRLFRETPHAAVLENWGLLWMLHSVKIFLLCLLTATLAWRGVSNPLWYLLLWGGGLMVWGAVFWRLRKRGGPVLFVERQVAHVWGGAIAATIGVFVVEVLLGLPVLSLSPMLAVIAGMVFTAKAGMLSGTFYVSAAALFLTAVPMALWPEWGQIIFGATTAVCFFVPGLKYHRQKLRSPRRAG
jgi:serine/threonine-protein kinase